MKRVNCTKLGILSAAIALLGMQNVVSAMKLASDAELASVKGMLSPYQICHPYSGGTCAGGGSGGGCASGGAGLATDPINCGSSCTTVVGGPSPDDSCGSTSNPDDKCGTDTGWCVATKSGSCGLGWFIYCSDDPYLCLYTCKCNIPSSASEVHSGHRVYCKSGSTGAGY